MPILEHRTNHNCSRNIDHKRGVDRPHLGDRSSNSFLNNLGTLMRLDAVKAVITGAGGGLGRTFTRELIKAGGKVSPGRDALYRDLSSCAACAG